MLAVPAIAWNASNYPSPLNWLLFPPSSFVSTTLTLASLKRNKNVESAAILKCICQSMDRLITTQFGYVTAEDFGNFQYPVRSKPESGSVSSNHFSDFSDKLITPPKRYIHLILCYILISGLLGVSDRINQKSLNSFQQHKIDVEHRLDSFELISVRIFSLSNFFSCCSSFFFLVSHIFLLAIFFLVACHQPIRICQWRLWSKVTAQ